jgi:hypothetical protein
MAKKDNFSKNGMNPIEETIRLEIARKHASHFTHHNIKEYSRTMSPTLSLGILTSTTMKSQNTYTCIIHPSSPLTFRLYQYPEKRIVADLIAAGIARERAITGATHEDQARAQRRWTKYLKSIGLDHDLYLTSFNRSQRSLLICAFATAIREARFSSDAFKTLAAGTVRNTISSVCSTFREHGHPNPSKDEDLQSCFLLQ